MIGTHADMTYTLITQFEDNFVGAVVIIAVQIDIQDNQFKWTVENIVPYCNRMKRRSKIPQFGVFIQACFICGWQIGVLH